MNDQGSLSEKDYFKNYYFSFDHSSDCLMHKTRLYLEHLYIINTYVLFKKKTQLIL